MDRESACRRGWSDFKANVTSWWFVLTDATLGVLLAAVVIWNWQDTRWGAGAGAGAFLGTVLLLLLWNLYRAPIRQRNEAWDREQQREQLRPEIGPQLKAFVIHNEGPSNVWRRHLLKVINPSEVTVSEYYARLREFRDMDNHSIEGLMEHDLSWYNAGRDPSEMRTTIPPEKSKYVDLLLTGYSDGDKIWVPRYDTAFPSIPAGEYYTAILEIGSYSEQVSVPPLDVELKIKYHGIHSLSVEIKTAPHIGIGPPEPDRTGL